jgi:hypothetical protein
VYAREEWICIDILFAITALLREHICVHDVKEEHSTGNSPSPILKKRFNMNTDADEVNANTLSLISDIYDRVYNNAKR